MNVKHLIQIFTLCHIFTGVTGVTGRPGPAMTPVHCWLKNLLRSQKVRDKWTGATLPGRGRRP